MSDDDFTLTPEQQTIIDAARNTTDNLLISALAGAAKTSTLVRLAREVKVPTLAISFNTRIAKEMKTRMPEWVESRTLNSLGLKVWNDNKGRRSNVEEAKVYRLTRAAIESVDDEKTRGELFDRMADLMQMVRYAKSNGYIPTGLYPQAKRLIGDDELLNLLDEPPSDVEWDIFQQVYQQSLAEALGEKAAPNLDFDDMLLMPTVFPASFASPPLVLVDEAQDLSSLNHAMLLKFARRRIIAVGDECQSIYGFRGAHEESMDLLRQTFNMTPLNLTVSFRCPVAVVEAARFRAPHMQYPEWAKPGTVLMLNHWGVEDLPDSATILCRNNAPLFNIAIRLLKNGRFPELIGNDIGKTLVRWLKKLGTPTTSQADALVALSAWRVEKLARNRNPTKVEDQAACLKIFIDQGPTLGDAIAYADHILQRTGTIKMMTIHKAKGLEWNNVFILDRDLIGDEQQELNLRYVAITRAKSTLTYINSDDFRGKEDNDV